MVFHYRLIARSHICGRYLRPALHVQIHQSWNHDLVSLGNDLRKQVLKEVILSYRPAWNERMYNCDTLILAYNDVKVWTYSSVFLGWWYYPRVGKDHIEI